TLKELISQTMVRWSQEDQIQDPELVRIMYTLLRRQYDSIGELLQALRKAYTISAASVKDTINLLAALGQIRSLLSVRMGKEEELLMINGLGRGKGKVLSKVSVCVAPSQRCCIMSHLPFPVFWRESIAFKIIIICCLLIFHWHASNLAGKSHLKGCRPLVEPVGCNLEKVHVCACCRYFTLPALEEPDLDKVVTYLAGCGLQSCPVLLAKGYPDIGWNPIEGERYLSFLRFAVFVN
ncbi:Ryanodine receptor 3, partial [Balearica regulorum gibbericeps]